jgi:putative nucleotidyltransferase with HDIG domain
VTGVPEPETMPPDPPRTRPSSQPVHRSSGRRLLDAFEAFERFPALVGPSAQALSDRRRSDADVIAAVESDLALTVALLRRANREAPACVATVRAAYALVGRDGLREVAAQLTSFDLFERAGAWGAAPHGHRVHAVATQRAAERIARALSYPRVDELLVATLLHDVGKLVLAFVEPRYAEIDRAAELAPERRIDLERRATGIDHALVGGVLVRRWGLPLELAHAVERHHHDPADAGLAGLVRLADMVARYEAGSAVSMSVMQRAAARLGLASAGLRDLLSAPAAPRRAGIPSPLTRGEQRVLAELANGLLYKQIAARLGVSVSTVRTHLHNTYRKLGVSDRAQAILMAKEQGWI